MKNIFIVTLFTCFVLSGIVISDTDVEYKSVHSLGCYWKIPEDFVAADGGNEYFSRLSGSTLNTISFKKEPFNSAILASDLISDVKERKYGDLTVYIYRVSDAGDKEQGFSTVEFPVVTVSREKEYVSFNNLTVDDIKVIAQDCIAGW